MANGMKTIKQYREAENVENQTFKGLECKQVIDDLANAFGRLHSLIGGLQGHSETIVAFAMLDIQDALAKFDIDIKEYYYYPKYSNKKHE